MSAAFVFICGKQGEIGLLKEWSLFQSAAMVEAV